MSRTRKTQKKTNKRGKRTTRTFKRSRVPPRRSVVQGFTESVGRGKSAIDTKFRKDDVGVLHENMRGGTGSTIFPSSLSNSDVAASPQSYLPFNNFSSDPGYDVIAARNTGPFLTGVASGGKRRNKKGGRKSRGKKIYGGSDISTTISNGLNTSTNSVGIMNSPALNETSGISGVMSQFSGTGSAYSSTPVTMARLA
jgi:hypothetical protein